MSQKNIRKAFEDRLVEMPLGLGASKTAFENVTFKPKVGEAYQRSVLAPITPENPTLGDGYFREVGFYQVVLSYPKGEGVGNITTKISPVYINDTRAEITIRIRYYSDQF